MQARLWRVHQIDFLASALYTINQGLTSLFVMEGFAGIGRILIIVGIIIVVLGLLVSFGGRIPFLGKLPGDILIRKDGFSFYFPIVTFLLLSVILTVIVNVILRFMGRM